MPKIIRGIFIAVFFTLIGASTGYCLTDSDVAQAIGTHRILARCTGSDVNLRSEKWNNRNAVSALDLCHPRLAVGRGNDVALHHVKARNDAITGSVF